MVVQDFFCIFVLSNQLKIIVMMYRVVLEIVVEAKNLSHDLRKLADEIYELF